MDDNKAKALAAALSQIEKQFGKGSIMRMGDGNVERDIQTVSTGSLGLDIALGLGAPADLAREHRRGDAVRPEFLPREGRSLLLQVSDLV